MLQPILSISGKSGLFRLVSRGKNTLIVEALDTKRRTPTYPSDRVVSLGDISIYTIEDDVPLPEVMETIYRKNEGKQLDAPALTKDNDSLRAFFGEVLPEYDVDRVYPSDIRKIISWYNLLVNNGFTTFLSDKKPAEEETTEKE
ncbi:DUF5606 domain-containing protein [Porphyromonas gingivalis]|uniref:DUF5606 family protein n=1 Tax=Porphyromonas gingivalis TaxID=837 RepID=UPI001F3E2512|nr:DUF5606 domain-containing protein [Porphyromonas gingivalis]MCE8191059.1 DUF5606 domain-containing protein [Porphyromonas gingivalis]